MLEYERDVNSARQTKETMVICLNITSCPHVPSSLPITIVENSPFAEHVMFSFLWINGLCVELLSLNSVWMDEHGLTRQLHPMKIPSQRLISLSRCLDLKSVIEKCEKQQ